MGTLRAIRRKPKEGKLISISGADPLNLVGILIPESRIPALPTNRILYRDGVAIGFQLGREVRLLDQMGRESEWTLRQALIRRPRKGTTRPSTGGHLAV